jgi:hypothetical protein
MVALLPIQDSVIWLRHLDDASLRERLLLLPADTPVALEVDGIRLEFSRMADGADGRPTPGLKPIGSSKQHWKRFWPARKGEIVTVREVDTVGSGVAECGPAPIIESRSGEGTRRTAVASIAWIEQELVEIPLSDIDSVALLDAVREGSAV